MATAEKLYTSGYISYPRTETNIFPKELNLTPLVENQVQDPRWGGNLTGAKTRESERILTSLAFASRILDDQGGPNPRAGKKSDQAHPPIHPTKAAQNLQGNNKAGCDC